MRTLLCNLLKLQTFSVSFKKLEEIVTETFHYGFPSESYLDIIYEITTGTRVYMHSNQSLVRVEYGCLNPPIAVAVISLSLDM